MNENRGTRRASEINTRKHTFFFFSHGGHPVDRVRHPLLDGPARPNAQLEDHGQQGPDHGRAQVGEGGRGRAHADRPGRGQRERHGRALATELNMLHDNRLRGPQAARRARQIDLTSEWN